MLNLNAEKMWVVLGYEDEYQRCIADGKPIDHIPRVYFRGADAGTVLDRDNVKAEMREKNREHAEAMRRELGESWVAEHFQPHVKDVKARLSAAAAELDEKAQVVLELGHEEANQGVAVAMIGVTKAIEQHRSFVIQALSADTFGLPPRRITLDDVDHDFVICLNHISRIEGFGWDDKVLSWGEDGMYVDGKKVMDHRDFLKRITGNAQTSGMGVLRLADHICAGLDDAEKKA